MKLSPVGLKFIEKWEEKVLYVYDDKVPKRRINGVLKYPEWDGGEVIGTLTIGYGHTDAAGWPKIKQGMRISDQEADEILDADLKPCMDSVNRLMAKLKIKLTQGQFDASTSFDFNCGAGNLAKLYAGLNQDNYEAKVPSRLMQYVHSKGEFMQGLANRRAGEIQLWHLPDDPEEHEAAPIPSTAERAPAPKSMLSSKVANTSILTGVAGGGVTLDAISSTTSTIKDVKGNVQELGVFDWLSQAMQTPYFWLGVLLVMVGGFIYWDRHRKLEQEHV